MPVKSKDIEEAMARAAALAAREGITDPAEVRERMQQARRDTVRRAEEDDYLAREKEAAREQSLENDARGAGEAGRSVTAEAVGGSVPRAPSAKKR